MNVEFVRDNLLMAFLVPERSGDTKVYNVKETRQSTAYMRKPFREEQLYSEDGPRIIHVPAEPVRASETRRYKGGKIPLPPRAFEDTAWIRAVRQIPAVHSIWLKYCYGDDLNWDGQVRLCDYIWHVFWRESLKLGVMPTEETELRMRPLIWLSVQSAKYQINRNQKMFMDSELASCIKVHQTVFSRQIKVHWMRMVACCIQLDHEALAYADRRYGSREQH